MQFSAKQPNVTFRKKFISFDDRVSEWWTNARIKVVVNHGKTVIFICSLIEIKLNYCVTRESIGLRVHSFGVIRSYKGIKC